MIVVGDAVVTVTTIVLGVSDSVTTRVVSCVVKTVSVRVDASVTVVADAPAPPSTATTEYEAGFLRSRIFGRSGQAFVRRRSEDNETAVDTGCVFILEGRKGFTARISGGEGRYDLE